MTLREDIPMLIAQSGSMAGHRWPLSRDALLVGRGPDCDIVVPDRQVSRHHARIGRDEDGYYVEDLSSKNGTHINGTVVSGRARLQDGDLIQVAFVLDMAFVGSEATLPLSSVEVAMIGEPSGRLRLESLSRRVWVGDREIDPPLSVPQYRLIEFLYRSAGKICSREEVIDVVWPEAAGAGISEQAIDALVRRLRDRLAEGDPGHQYIVTVRGHGFRLDNPPE